MSKAQSKRQAASRIPQPKSRAKVSAARVIQGRSSSSILKRHPGRDPAPSDTKMAQIVALLRSSTGTTIDAMTKVTGWQRHSVRGFLSGVVRNKLGLNLVSEAGEAGRRYRIEDKKEASALRL
jgi:hypothetical protein